MRNLFAAVLLLAALLQARGQTSIPVQFPQDPSRNGAVASLSRGGSTFISLNDLARLLGIQMVVHDDTRKMELHTDMFTVKVTANNPFVIIVDKKGNGSLVQLPVNTLYSSRAFFAPVDPFIPLLKNALAEEITFDRRSITVGRPRPVSAFDITGLAFSQKSNGYLVRILCSRKLPDYESFLKQIGNDTWLYITIANARADLNAIRAVPPTEVVKKVMVFQYPTSVQLTFRLKGQFTTTEPIAAENGNDILVSIHMPSPAQVASRSTHDFERTLQRERDKWKLDVVVLDAGHGGDDPGTIGVLRTKEKDVTLGIALKLGKLIEKRLPGVKVVYTRRRDEFVELYRRGQIANEMGGKLFISIHCNAMPHRPNPMHGFEIYLLRPGKTENALRIAERENAVIKLEQGYQDRYQQLTDENFILLTMAQSAYVKYSEDFANILQQEMGKHLDISSNGVKQAGFYVLVGASMPNVLVETAYLSNRHDELILRSAAGQQHIAEAIFNGVKRYKLQYEKSLTEGKNLGASTN